MPKQLYVGLLISSVLAMGCRSTLPPPKYAMATPPVPQPTKPTHPAAESLKSHGVTQASAVVVVSAPEVVLSDAATPDAASLDAASLDAASPEASRQQSIDLTTALMMTTGQNPQVAFARARIEEALAQLDRANALKLPSLRAGVNYNKHEGRIQDVAGSVIETSRGSFYSGFGANAVGAGSPAVPGIVSQFHFADAIFQPKIAQRTACARQAGAMATTNDQLLATAIAYMELLRAEQERSIADETVQRAEQLDKTTGEYEKAGEGLASDHDRTRTELALRRLEQSRSEEAASVASARLAEMIRWDSSQRLIPAERQLVPMDIVTVKGTPQDWVATALTHRPELAESRHLVGEAVERLHRERNAPLVPSVLLAASYGGHGGGLGSNLANYGDRLDADASAYWEVRQLGLGENASRREARSRIVQARMREMATMDRIAREVNESSAQVQFRKKQIEASREAVQAAMESYEKNWDRIRNGKGLPIEALQSIQALATAQREYIRSVSEYNSAQFTMQRALGWPISEPASAD